MRGLMRTAVVVVAAAAIGIPAGCRAASPSSFVSRGESGHSSVAVDASAETTLGTPPQQEAWPEDIELAKQAARAHLARELDWDFALTLDRWGGGEGLGRHWRVSQTWWAEHDSPPHMYVLLSYRGEGVGAFGWVDVAKPDPDSEWTVVDHGGGY